MSSQPLTSLRRNKGSEFSRMIGEVKHLGLALCIPCLDGKAVLHQFRCFSIWGKDSLRRCLHRGRWLCHLLRNGGHREASFWQEITVVHGAVTVFLAVASRRSSTSLFHVSAFKAERLRLDADARVEHHRAEGPTHNPRPVRPCHGRAGLADRCHADPAQ